MLLLWRANKNLVGSCVSANGLACVDSFSGGSVNLRHAVAVVYIGESERSL
jgi:hypothetical protein